MTRKKESNTSISQEDNAQIQHILEQTHQIAGELHSSTDREQSEAALTEIHSMPAAAQMALLKTLSKEHDTDAADILLAIHELSPDKILRKEARRSLIRLEEVKIYPHWNPPIANASVVQALTSNPARFWKGWITQSREEGEVQLILCWEEGYEYNEIRMLTFLLDFWEQGLKDFILETTNKRNVEARLQHMRSQLPDITITDCTLAEGRRFIEEALAVNKWRGTTPHKDYRHHLPTVKQLVLDTTDVGEDRGLTFINPALEADEVVATFVGAWALGDYGLTSDLLSSDSSLRNGLTREEWIERHHTWTKEAKPTRFELGFVREREPSRSALWLPSSFSSSTSSSRKEIEVGWSLELTDTQLSGTFNEMPMGTAVNKETGRHWFWTSYTLVQNQGEWRIQSMTDEGAKAQGFSIAELQKRLKEHDDRLQEIIKKPEPSEADIRQAGEEITWRMTQALHYDDALLVKLPLDRTYYGDGYSRTTSLGQTERSMVYLERMASRFAEQRAAALCELGVAQEKMSDFYAGRGMDERGTQFSQLAESSFTNSLAIENSIAAHALLAETLIRRGEKLDEAETHLQQAKELASNPSEEAMIEADLANLAVERHQLNDALHHYQRVADIEPNFPDIWFKIGFMYRNLQQFEDAKLTYEHVIEVQPQDIRAYSELSVIYMNEHALSKAHETLEQGLRNNPNSAHLLALLSSVYLEGGDYHRADATLTDAEQINPSLEIVQVMREYLAQSQKK